MSSTTFLISFVIVSVLLYRSVFADQTTPTPDKGTEYLREICKILKPSSSFQGIQVYHRIQRVDKKKLMSSPVGHYLMYRSGKEWEFTVWLSYQNMSRPRIDLLDQTLANIRDDGLPVLHQFSVYFDYDNVKDKRKRSVNEFNGVHNQKKRAVDLLNGVHDCDVSVTID